MVPFVDLWLAILLSAVFVFVVSSILHMILPIHKSDFRQLPNEDDVLATLGAEAPAPGDYFFPAAPSMKEMSSPEMVEKQNRGPVGFLTIMPNGPMKMGKSLLIWFLYTILVGCGVAFIASRGLPLAAPFADVFWMATVASMLAYGVSSISNSIWKGVKWGITAKYIFDGAVYAAVTGATFAAFWPTPQG